MSDQQCSKCDRQLPDPTTTKCTHVCMCGTVYDKGMIFPFQIRWTARPMVTLSNGTEMHDERGEDE